jgi:hypothetical protein
MGREYTKTETLQNPSKTGLASYADAADVF